MAKATLDPRLTEVMAAAGRVLGSRAAAGAWLRRPAIALNNARPIDLLGTAEGVDAVRDLLVRLEHNVYT